MLFSRRRVEEDLEKIRKANLPPEKLEEERRREQKGKENLTKLEKGDIPAMIIAAFSVLLPYVLIFAGILVLAFLAIRLFW
jgi:hypothetical protein